MLRSAEWWNGLLDWIRSGRLQVDPRTGLEIREGPGNATLAETGTRRRCWAKAASTIPAATGTGSTQMGSGTVRLWYTTAEGDREDSGVDVLAFNGSVTSVPTGAWLKVELEDEIWQIYYVDCP